MRHSRTVGIALALGSLLGARPLRAEEGLEALAARFAPVIRQDTASSQDYLTAFDFDGNWAGDDNWKNQSKFPLKAHVYWAGVETSTHVYLNYGFFHPRDVARTWEVWASRLGRLTHIHKEDPEHENDLEGMLLVLEKGRGGPHPVVAETIYHRVFKKYRIDARYQSRGYELDGTLPFEGEHPVVQVQSHGHGVTAWDGKGFPGGDGVIYRVGSTAGIPRNDDDRDVSYALADLETTLWARRYDIGTHGNTFGEGEEIGGEFIGTSLLGRVGEDNGANVPWSWHDSESELPAGTIFLDPARLLADHFTVPQALDRTYEPNPFTLRRVAVAVRPAAVAEVATPAGEGLLGQTE